MYLGACVYLVHQVTYLVQPIDTQIQIAKSQIFHWCFLLKTLHLLLPDLRFHN